MWDTWRKTNTIYELLWRLHLPRTQRLGEKTIWAGGPSVACACAPIWFWRHALMSNPQIASDENWMDELLWVWYNSVSFRVAEMAYSCKNDLETLARRASGRLIGSSWSNSVYSLGMVFFHRVLGWHFESSARPPFFYGFGNRFGQFYFRLCVVRGRYQLQKVNPLHYGCQSLLKLEFNTTINWFTQQPPH